MKNEMKKYTLRENVERTLGALAQLEVEKSLDVILDTNSKSEFQKGVDRGVLAIIRSVCESLQAALDNSKTTKD